MPLGRATWAEHGGDLAGVDGPRTRLEFDEPVIPRDAVPVDRFQATVLDSCDHVEMALAHKLRLMSPGACFGTSWVDPLSQAVAAMP